MASITQPTQFYVELVVFLSFKRIKGGDWKLVERVGTKYLDSFGFCFWLSQIHFLYYGKLFCLNCVFFSLKSEDLCACSIYLPLLSVTRSLYKGDGR